MSCPAASRAAPCLVPRCRPRPFSRPGVSSPSVSERTCAAQQAGRRAACRAAHDEPQGSGNARRTAARALAGRRRKAVSCVSPQCQRPRCSNPPDRRLTFTTKSMGDPGPAPRQEGPASGNAIVPLERASALPFRPGVRLPETSRRVTTCPSAQPAPSTIRSAQSSARAEPLTRRPGGQPTAPALPRGPSSP